MLFREDQCQIFAASSTFPGVVSKPTWPSPDAIVLVLAGPNSGSQREKVYKGLAGISPGSIQDNENEICMSLPLLLTGQACGKCNPVLHTGISQAGRPVFPSYSCGHPTSWLQRIGHRDAETGHQSMILRPVEGDDGGRGARPGRLLLGKTGSRTVVLSVTAHSARWIFI